MYIHMKPPTSIHMSWGLVKTVYHCFSLYWGLLAEQRTQKKLNDEGLGSRVQKTGV